MKGYKILNLKNIILSILCISCFITCSNTKAVSLAGFQAGNIIDDIVMTNSQSMNVSQIQEFLNSKVPVCDNWGTNGSTSTSRRDYFNSRGWPLPLTCLKDFQENGKSSAQIIYDAAQEYTINPQVLIVLLQKEQGLVTDDWPDPTQYRAATGYGCPDTAACDSYYYGFTNQVRNAAKMYRRILDASPNWYTPYVLGVNYIQYSPDPNCGGSWVNIQNRATQGLYNYTPYQPNQASLNAGYGSGDYCSSHGNRNFYLYFNDWFGSTYGYINLQTPRWMEISTDVYKKNIIDNTDTDVFLPKGKQLKFTTKIYKNGEWYLRTDYDTLNENDFGIPLSSIIDISYKKLTNPIDMSIKTKTNKLNPKTGKVNISQEFQPGIITNITDEITVDNIKYYRSSYDSNRNSDNVFEASVLSDIVYKSFERPRYMATNEIIYKTNVLNMELDDTPIPENTHFLFSSKIFIGGKYYYRTSDDSIINSNQVIESSKIKELSFEAFSDGPRWLYLINDSNKIQTQDLSQTNINVLKYKQLFIVDKIFVNGQWYYRTEYDSKRNSNFGIISTNFDEIPFSQMDNPRYMKTIRNTTKVFPKTGLSTNIQIPINSQIKFTTKIIINGKVYLRTEYDTNLNSETCIPYSDLLEI